MESRFNLARKMVDHRKPYDLNYAINRPPFSQGWKAAYKQKWLGILMKAYGLYGSFAAVVFSLTGIYLDALWREKKPVSHQSAAFKGENNRTAHFLRHHKNKNEDLGNWNHNFACYEKDPYCGRDFDWVYKQ